VANMLVIAGSILATKIFYSSLKKNFPVTKTEQSDAIIVKLK